MLTLKIHFRSHGSRERCLHAGGGAGCSLREIEILPMSHWHICAMNGGVYVTVPALTASRLDYSELQLWAATHTADILPGFLRNVPPRDSGPINWKLEKNGSSLNED